MNEAIYWYAVSAVVLFLKVLAISAYQGFHRIGKPTFKTPEDAAYLGRESAKEELPQVRRAARAWLNDLESIPISLGLGVAYIFVEAPPGWAARLMLIFTEARHLQTLFYLLAVQPWRKVAYAVGVVCMFIMSIQIRATLH